MKIAGLVGITDEELIVRAMRDAQSLLAEHIERGPYDAEQAITELRKASELDPAFADPFYALGRVYRRTGDQARAEQAFSAFRAVKNAEREHATISPAKR